jgi:hypothetical protein
LIQEGRQNIESELNSSPQIFRWTPMKPILTAGGVSALRAHFAAANGIFVILDSHPA